MSDKEYQKALLAEEARIWEEVNGKIAQTSNSKKDGLPQTIDPDAPVFRRWGHRAKHGGWFNDDPDHYEELDK